MTVASPRLAPTGGQVPLFGNNPIAVAIPGDCDFPLVLDIAVGSLAAGKLELARRCRQGHSRKGSPGISTATRQQTLPWHSRAR